jgi:hypothetical protein
MSRHTGADAAWIDVGEPEGLPLQMINSWVSVYQNDNIEISKKGILYKISSLMRRRKLIEQ